MSLCQLSSCDGALLALARLCFTRCASGLSSAFAYAIKFTGILVLPAAMAAVIAASRRTRPALMLAVGVALIAPWMIRDTVMSGNPVAPLFNRWFPNPYFHTSMEA